MQSVALHIVAFVVFLREYRVVGYCLITAENGTVSEVKPECE